MGDKVNSNMMFCRKDDDGEWREVCRLDDIGIVTDEIFTKDDIVGMDFQNTGFAVDDVFETEFSVQISAYMYLTLVGIQVVNVITCKNCLHRGTDNCPKMIATDDNGFCDKGVRKD